MKSRPKLDHEGGQVALMMVLIMTIISAVVVSLAGRVTTETRVQNMLTDSTNAFLVAQSGIEEAVQLGTSIDEKVVASDKSYVVKKSEEGKEYVLSDVVSPGTSLELSLEGAVLGAVKIFWTSPEGTPSSILVSIDYGSGIRDSTYDSLGLNGFTKVTSGGSVGGVNFDFVTPEISLPAGAKLIRVKVFGNSASVGVVPVGGIFPAQTLKYRSSGVVGTGNQKTKYGLEYEESKLNKVPDVFDYVLFSYGTIIQ